MRFQINTVNFTNFRFHVQNVSFDITSITLVWTGEAAEEPCKELMALSPLPPLGSQGSRVSPGEPPRPPFDWSATSPLACLHTVPRRHITEHVLRRAAIEPSAYRFGSINVQARKLFVRLPSGSIGFHWRTCFPPSRSVFSKRQGIFPLAR